MRTILLGPFRPEPGSGLGLAQIGNKTGNFSILFPVLPEDGTRIQLPKCVNFIILKF
jgi:hypothetical protein